MIIKILFVCHGNICRSPMAQSIMSWLLEREGMSDCVHVDSVATSTEEIGNGVHWGTREKLREMGIPCLPHHARQITRFDIERSDYVIAMDALNIRNLRRMFGDRVPATLLLDYTDSPRDISDPWYSGNFDATFDDILKGCQGLLEEIKATLDSP